MSKICQQFKKRKTIYGRLPPNKIAELKPWDTVHVNLIGPYTKSIRQKHLGGAIIKNNASLNWMNMIKPALGWFEITKVLTYDLDEVTGGNDKYIDKSSTRVRPLFKNTWLNRYPHPRKVMFDNWSDFKLDFYPLLKDFDIEPVLTTIKTPQDSAPVERLHQVILNIIVTKDIFNKVFEYIDPWD